MKIRFASKWMIGGYVACAIWIALFTTKLLTPLEAFAVCALTYGVVAVWKLVPVGYAMAWPRKEIGTRSGARDEISQLAWLLFGRDTYVSFGGMRHIRQTTGAVFASVGLDLNQPKHAYYVQQRVGQAVTQALQQTEATLTQKQLRQLISFLENIEAELKDAPLPAIHTTSPLESSHDH
jgi:hypothetical protein